MKLEEIQKLCDEAVSCCDELEIRRIYMGKLLKLAQSCKIFLSDPNHYERTMMRHDLKELENEA